MIFSQMMEKLFNKIYDIYWEFIGIDKVFHYLAGIIGVWVGMFYLFMVCQWSVVLAFLGTHIFIIIANCIWEGFLFKNTDDWCWYDWFSVELGAITTTLIMLNKFYTVIPALVIASLYYLIVAYIWEFWPFNR